MTDTLVEPYPPGTRVRAAWHTWTEKPTATVLGTRSALDGTVCYVVRIDGPLGISAEWSAGATIGPPPPPAEPSPVLPPSPPDEHDLDVAFAAYHKAHPETYDTLARLARQALAKGCTRGGMKMLFEVARWEQYLATGDDGYKLNNSFASRYARLLMEREPDLQGFFETRGLRS